VLVLAQGFNDQAILELIKRVFDEK